MAQSTLKNYSNNLFSNHFLKERIQDTEEWSSVNFEKKFEDFKEIYDKNKGFLSNKLNEDQTQNKFIDPVLKELGHEWTPEARRKVGSQSNGKTLNPDYAFLGMEKQLDIHEDDEKDYFDGAYAIGDAKAWNRTLDKSSQDHTNPAFQIYNYVDRLRADWGILTNGKKWRLYSYEKCAADIYFEVDLEAILAGKKTEEKVEAFKYFYLIFRRQSYHSEGRSFLEKIYEESVNFAEGLEDDLEDKVYDALEVALEGFFETNDIEKTQENIDLVHHAALIFLYRTLFILNAESRDLLPTDDEAYRQAFGLTQLKRMIVDDEEDDPLFQDTTVAWDNRLSRLFEGIDEGYELHETEIPAYNGGLFDEENGEENKFLAENKLYGSYIKEILKLLSTKYDEEKEKRIIIDYKDLNIRHLGSVYEGLLEHKFKAADQRKVLKKGEWEDFSETNKDWENFDEDRKVEENELYLTNESGERKATGSYYTPEYIVEYIVENTVGPKVEEKIEEAEQNGDNILPKILELNVCDPAMGSGHFLTDATEFIAEKIVEHADLEKQDIDENEDELNWAKRQVVQNCIYGVDINPLAVELGKLSLWIETMAEGKPLNFLDHHLKHGNSLIGSDFDEIFSHPFNEEQKGLDNKRFTFGTPDEIKENFRKKYSKIEEMPENTVKEIHKKEEEYKEFVKDFQLYKDFIDLANIHTRQYFENEIDTDEYESFITQLGSKSQMHREENWYNSAQEDAENRNYFHWQLEFPKVFFGEQEGFDAVVGNPPWGAKFDDSEKSYYKEKFRLIIDRMTDSYMYFTKLGSDLSSQKGKLGYITPSPFLTQSDVSQLRKYMLEQSYLESIINLGDDVFGEDVDTPSCVIISSFDGKSLENTSVEDLSHVEPEKKANLIGKDGKKVKQSFFQNQHNYAFITSKLESSKIVGELRDRFETLDEYIGEINRGISSDFNDAFIVSEEVKDKKNLEDEKCEPVLEGSEVRRFSVENSERYVIYLTRDDDISNYPNIKSHLSNYRDEITCSEVEKGKHPWYSLHRPRDDSIFNSPKLVGLTTCNHLEIATETRGRYLMDSLYVFQLESDYNPVQLSILLNSSLLNYIYRYFAQEDDRILPQVKSENMYPLPVPSPERFEEFFSDNIEMFTSEISEEVDSIKEASDYIGGKIRKKKSINLNIQDYLGNYSDGKSLGDLSSPPKGVADSILEEDASDRDSLRIGSVDFEERNDDLVLMASARYKPEDSENIDEDELDRWGYFETSKVPAMKLTGLSKEMKSLVKEFTKLAVDEAGGFAGFRESATKTNSIIDRLEKLTLPKLEDVESGLEKFVENREEAEELEEEIQKTDELIDAIVFDLYDLTEEEVETVLDSLDTEEDEKQEIIRNFKQL